MYFSKKVEDLLENSKTSVRNERIALGLTQKEFADFIGLKYATYRYFEQEGKVSLENFLLILEGLNKTTEFQKFLKGFEFENSKQRAVAKKEDKEKTLLEPIVSPSQKQITLDKEIFGNELFYSVENGHVYEVSTLISIVLAQYNDERLRLLLRYFGPDRLKPYILEQKNMDLLKKFKKHVQFLSKKV